MNGPLRRLAAVIAVLFASLLASATYVQVLDAPALAKQPTNTRTLYSKFSRERGPLLVGGTPIAKSQPVDDPYKYLRVYPGGRVWSNLTGYFSVVYGSTGLEAAETDLLNGTSDQLFYRRLRDLFTGQRPRGASVELTVDAKVQQVAWNALGNKRGAVVALDPSTGNILAMVTKPSYDANKLAGHDPAVVRKNRAALLADPDDPLIDRSISSLYPPGSTFKVITSAAALSSGKFNPQSMLPGPKELKLPQTTVTLGNDEGTACTGSGQISLTDALRVSCNTAFGALGLSLGDQALREQAQKFGFGADLNIPLRVATSSIGAQLNQPQTAQSAIGQYEDKVTPLQMAMVSAAIANRGTLMKPNLVRRVLTSDLKVIQSSSPEKLSDAVTPQVAEQLKGMMEAVVESGTGTRAQISGVIVAGKTGTAQHGDDAAGNPLPPHAWFTAFAPADAPKVAVAVVIEDGGGRGDAATGGKLAAPVAKQVIEAVLGR